MEAPGGTYWFVGEKMRESFPGYPKGFMQDMANGLAAHAAAVHRPVTG